MMGVNPETARTLSKGDLVELVEQLASLTRAGVPLPSGLRASAEELISPSLRASFLRLASTIESGEKLEAALGTTGSFPPELRGLIEAGSRSGKLSELLSEFVRSANLGTELGRMFWGTLIYPAVMLLIILVIVQIVCSIVVPSTSGFLFYGFGMEPPAATRVLMGLSKFIADHGIAMILGLILVPVAIIGLIRLGCGPVRRRRILCGVPLIGPIIRACSLCEFCHRLAMLVEAEVPLPTAFELAGSSIGDPEVAEACHRMGRAVEQGEPLWKAMSLWNSIPAGLSLLFRWSEDRRSLPVSLQMAGEMFEARARSQTSFARSILSTILFLLIFWCVGFLVAVLFLPMIGMYSGFRFW
jgi:type II secretory pathway component PulF